MPTDLDVICIGNAIVDVLSHAADDDIVRLDLNRGTMTLIEEDRAAELYAAMGPAVEASGGSAANTAAGIASLGGRAGFIGKVRDDAFGQIFAHDIKAIGVDFPTPPATEGPPTASCYIFITSDAHRTMNTYLGACVNLTPQDIDPAFIGRAQVTYMEGYLWDRPAAKDAFLTAAREAHGHGRKVSLTLSDPFCVDRHRDSFRDLVKGHVDILFANEDEIVSLYQVADFDAALQHARADCQIAALTRSEKGSVVIAGDEVHIVDAEAVPHVADTTGAGDLYASGFLYGLTNGHDLATCGRLGAIAAGEVISHVGSRPEVPLKDFAEERLGLKGAAD